MPRQRAIGTMHSKPPASSMRAISTFFSQVGSKLVSASVIAQAFEQLEPKIPSLSLLSLNSGLPAARNGSRLPIPFALIYWFQNDWDARARLQCAPHGAVGRECSAAHAYDRVVGKLPRPIPTYCAVEPSECVMEPTQWLQAADGEDAQRCRIGANYSRSNRASFSMRWKSSRRTRPIGPGGLRIFVVANRCARVLRHKPGCGKRSRGQQPKTYSMGNARMMKSPNVNRIFIRSEIPMSPKSRGNAGSLHHIHSSGPRWPTGNFVEGNHRNRRSGTSPT
jgi:hypothetical protein